MAGGFKAIDGIHGASMRERETDALKFITPRESEWRAGWLGWRRGAGPGATGLGALSAGRAAARSVVRRQGRLTRSLGVTAVGASVLGARGRPGRARLLGRGAGRAVLGVESRREGAEWERERDWRREKQVAAASRSRRDWLPGARARF
jgi:hypothetical protein